MTISKPQNSAPSDREILLKDWLASISDQTLGNIQPASADASFRRYFRVTGESDGKTYIVMDAPPDKEDCKPFIHVTKLLRDAGVNAPEIIKDNIEQGFLLLSDLGNEIYLDHLTNEKADILYAEAISALILMQKIENNLPQYNAQRLRDEMNLFEPWYLNKHLNVHLNETQKKDLESIYDLLIKNAIEQPQVFVHRDYHSRNLMLLDENNPGVIDYQDAVIGPITYDLVSLLKDCYIEWPENKIEEWIDSYLLECSKEGNRKFSKKEFIRWFDLMGVQRHLKVLGIFSRLNYRDGKKQYLDDLPLTLKYVVNACRKYKELESLRRLMEQLVLSHPMVSEK
jgi:aminoglycoside/choline kinase family phosphotransferase